MHAITAKFLILNLAAMLSLPGGFCCGETAAASDPSQQAVPDQNCCSDSTTNPQPTPTKSATKCCCQERITTTAGPGAVKLVPLAAYLPVALPSDSRIAAPAVLSRNAFYGSAKHSTQSILCVWRL